MIVLRSKACGFPQAETQKKFLTFFEKNVQNLLFF